jgi:hypothetical protein
MTYNVRTGQGIGQKCMPTIGFTRTAIFKSVTKLHVKKTYKAGVIIVIHTLL